MDYAIVAQTYAGSVEIVAEVVLGNRDYGKVVNALLQKATINTKKSYSYENRTINYIVSHGTIFLCVCSDDFQSRIAFAFLQKMEEEYDGRPDFENRMKQWIGYYNEDTNADKIRSVQDKLDNVRDIMVENIESVLMRGEKLEDLMATTEQMQEDATSFEKGSKRLKKKLWFKSMWLTIIIICILLMGFFTFIFFAIIVILLLCGMFSGFDNC